MPRSTPTRCREPGCSARVRPPGYCETHRKKRGRELRRLYTWHDYGGDWPAKAKRVLAEEPFCRCGCGRPSEIADHIIELLDIELGLEPMPAGGPHARSNLQGLARTCHAHKTREARKRRARRLSTRHA